MDDANGPADPAGGRVVTGVDGSPGSRRALVFALTEAARRGVALEVVSTWPLPLPWSDGKRSLVPDPQAVRARTEERTVAMVADVRGDPALASDPAVAGVGVTVFVSEGPAAPVLRQRARGADLLVVGSRGRGVVRSAVLGSVALHCAASAPCPVVVVPADPGGATREARVVVGIDGSPASRAALAVAVDAAGRWGRAVEAVAAYEPDDQWTDLLASVAPSFQGVRADVERAVRALVDEVLAGMPAPGDGAAAPAVTTVVAEGAPSDVLTARTPTAALLVVGSRGLDGLRGLLLGSVALRCLAAAVAPVMVVHPQQEATDVEERSPASLAAS